MSGDTASDPWEGPACETCHGRGEIVFTRGANHWMSVECVDCHGTGLAGYVPVPQYRKDGYRVPEDGEEYDPAVHGPLPPATGEYRAWWPPGR